MDRSRFTIDLPENKKGNVWRLDMVNMRHIDNVDFGSAKVISSTEPQYTFKGCKYEITISGEEGDKVYILYKFTNGEWFADFIEKKPIVDRKLLIIKKAILNREKELNDI